jgi:hypothetical protein
MGALLVFLSLVIGGYGYLTDSDRVRAMAEGYLSGLVGGRVEVGGANLSIFEGLRLNDVKVYVDDPGAATQPSQPGPGADGQPADSVLFSARSFLISYDPRSMLRGELQATQIVAERPHVQLTQDVQSGTWNFARLGQNRRARPQAPSSKPFKPSELPELLLRDAKVEISELRDGKSSSLGYIAIDGRLTPNGENRAEGYDFVLQSRGVSDATGPLASGSVNLGSRHVTARLGQFEFGRDIRSMLVSEVRGWTDRHELAGRVSIPWLDYSPGPPDDAGHDGKTRFTVQMALEGVNLTVPAEEWVSEFETSRRMTSLQGLDAVQRAYRIAGLVGPSRPTSVESDQGPSGPTAKSSAASTPADTLALLLEPTPLQLRRMAGTFVFTDDGIAVEQVSGRVEDNGFKINGHIDGYRPDAAMALQIASLDSEDLSIPASPRYVWSLPRDYREVYEHLRPQGSCRLQLNLTRAKAGAQIRAGGYVDIVEGEFVFNQFPYPLRDVSGRVSFGREVVEGSGPEGWDFVHLNNLRGRGVVGGPNQDGYLTLNGRIGPVGPPGGPETGFDLVVHADDIRSEPPLMQAFSPEVHQALSLFDAPGKGEFPQFRGAFSTHVLRKIGANQRITYDTDISLVDATGALVGFPYPVRNIAAEIRVRDGYVDVVSAKMHRGNATLDVNGRVTWNDPAAGAAPTADPTALTVTVRNLPVDDDLLGALPPDCTDWIRKTGVKALLDVDGTLRAPPMAIEHPDADATTRPSTAGLDYDFAITLHDGSVRPRNGAFVVSDVGGRMRLTRDRLDLLTVHGRHDKAALTAKGSVTWTGDTPHLAFTASGSNIALEPSLYALLPPAARDAWDELQPLGTLDAEVSYAPVDTPVVAAPTVRVDLTTAPAVAVTQAAAPEQAVADSGLPPGFRATLKPRALTATLRTIPYRLDKVGGRIEISPQGIVLRDITAAHDKARFTLGGTGSVEQGTTWDLRLTARDVETDADLHRALPLALTDLIDAMKLKGKLGVRLDRFVYRPPPTPGSLAATMAPGGPDPEIDLRGAVTLDGANLDVGVPINAVKGDLNFNAAVRHDRLQSLTGSLDLASLRMADRTVTDFKAALLKPADRPELLINEMQGGLAGGDLAGQASLSFPEEGPSRYVLSLAVRNADVKELAGETDQNLAGRLTASLAMEGAWGKPEARRGRGDVVVTGKDMYRIPVILGLLQITNLSLPVSSPFSSGIARYSVEGQKVSFEKIELRSDNMVMSGDGKLDFATKQVRMNFVTDNPGGFKVPFVQDLWRGAQHELLRIQVRGTVQDPKVETRSMGTLWTTVDEVLKGDTPEDKRAAHKHHSTSD